MGLSYGGLRVFGFGVFGFMGVNRAVTLGFRVDSYPKISQTLDPRFGHQEGRVQFRLMAWA